MLEILQFIFSDEKYFVGTLLLIGAIGWALEGLITINRK